MNTTQLECFLAVADHLNFARAAEDLHITQPAVTHQINSLEDEFKVKFFRRTTRSVMLTQEGMNFLIDAKNILQSVNLAKARFSSQQCTSISHFNIGCHSEMELALLPSLLNGLVRQYPNVHPVIHTLPFRALESLLENESLDVMLDYKEEKRSRASAYHELYRAEIICALPKGHPCASRGHIDTETLQKEKMVLLDLHKVSSTLCEIQKPFALSHMPSDLYFCENFGSALTLVKAGLGIMLLPDIKPLRDPGICYLPLKYSAALSYGLHYKPNRRTEVLKTFISLADEMVKTASLHIPSLPVP